MVNHHILLAFLNSIPQSSTLLAPLSKQLVSLSLPSWFSWTAGSIQSNIHLQFQFSCSVLSNNVLPHGLQHARSPCPSPTLGAYSKSCPSSQWCHPTIHPMSSSSPPTFNLSKHQGLFYWVSSLHQVEKVLEFQLQHQSFQWIFQTDFL